MAKDEPEHGELVLIPQPRDVRWYGSEIEVGRLVLAKPPAKLATYERVIADLVTTVSGGFDNPQLLVTFEHCEADPEEYVLRIDENGVRIGASDGCGALHAVRTLVDLWDSDTRSTLPIVTIADGPDFSVRGVFIESCVGADHMSLIDWQQLVDRLGQLKFNTLGISLYGCWDIHHGERSEWLFSPLDSFPQLRTPRRMVTWDPETEQEIAYDYLPTMFESDYFSDVVRYATERGIDVLPHWGGPGHSTLIPRCLPELSALDDDGVPTGYGYCVTRDSARATLERLMRNLVRQHLVPNGLRRLHVAADEYYPIRNVDPEDRKRVISPYCRCDGCRELSVGQMLIEYLLLVGRALAKDGIAMVHWHDSLVREGVLGEYLRRCDDLGLPRPTIAWWKYNDPVPAPDAGRTETWSCPTVGLNSFLFQQDYLSNIETTLRRGRRSGTVGAFAYSLIDPADHMNYAFLADLAWRCDCSEGAEWFRRRWARFLCPDAAESARHALSSASTITACYPLMMYVINHMMPFFATTTAETTSYPDDVLCHFSVTQPAVADVLRQVAETLRDAQAMMPDGVEVRHWGNPVATWRNETTRLVQSLDLFLAVLDAARMREPFTEQEGVRLEKQSTELLRLAATSKASYVAPMTLREHWEFIRQIEPAVMRLRDSDRLRPTETWYAWQI